jgi:hypothetical protein
MNIVNKSILPRIYDLLLRGSVGELDFLLPLWLSGEPLPQKIILCPGKRKNDIEIFFKLFFDIVPRIISYETDIDFKEYDENESKFFKIIYHLRFTTRSILFLTCQCFRKNLIVGWDIKPSNLTFKFCKTLIYIPTSIDATRQRYDAIDTAKMENRIAKRGKLLIYDDLSDWTVKYIAESGYDLEKIQLPILNEIRFSKLNNLYNFNIFNEKNEPSLLIVLSSFNSVTSFAKRKKLFFDYIFSIIESYDKIQGVKSLVHVFAHPRTDRSMVIEIIDELNVIFPDYKIVFQKGLVIEYLFKFSLSKTMVVGGPTGAKAWFEIFGINYFVFIPKSVLEINNRIKFYEKKYKELTNSVSGGMSKKELNEWFYSKSVEYKNNA